MSPAGSGVDVFSFRIVNGAGVLSFGGLGLRFGGDDLSVSFVSDFRRNELDRVTDDILDVADRTIAKEIASGHLTMQTVGEYCDLMARCSRTRRNDVLKLLEIDESQGA